MVKVPANPVSPPDRDPQNGDFESVDLPIVTSEQAVLRVFSDSDRVEAVVVGPKDSGFDTLSTHLRNRDLSVSLVSTVNDAESSLIVARDKIWVLICSSLIPDPKPKSDSEKIPKDTDQAGLGELNEENGENEEELIEPDRDSTSVELEVGIEAPSQPPAEGLARNVRPAVQFLNKLQSNLGHIFRNQILTLLVDVGGLDDYSGEQLEKAGVDGILRHSGDIQSLQLFLRKYRAERKKQARLKTLKDEVRKRDITINDLVKAGRALAGKQGEIDWASQCSKPARNADKDPMGMFSHCRPKYGLVSQDDWEIDRSIEESSEVVGVDLLALEKMACRSKQNPVTVHLGPGSGAIMDEFAEKGVGSEQVGIAKSMESRLDQLMNRALHPDYIDHENLQAFNRIFAGILLANEGRNGRTEINFEEPSDQNRLKAYMMRTAQSEQAAKHAAGVRYSRQTRFQQMFPRDFAAKLKDDVLALFEELCQDPDKFFRKYYRSDFHPHSKHDMRPVLGIKDRKMLYMYFERLARFLRGRMSDDELERYYPGSTSEKKASMQKSRGKLWDLVVDIKSFSHVGDRIYARATNEILARLDRGGIAVLNGFTESYTSFQRIDQLRRIKAHLNSTSGDEYRFYLVGNDNEPTAVLVERASTGKKGRFIGMQRLHEVLLDGRHITVLEDYDKMWPKRSLQNHLIRIAKMKAEAGLTERITAADAKVETIRTWKQATFKQVARAIAEFMEVFGEDKKWQRSLRSIARYQPGRARIHSGSARHKQQSRSRKRKVVTRAPKTPASIVNTTVHRILTECSQDKDKMGEMYRPICKYLL